MKAISKLAIPAALVLLVAAGSQPAQAICTSAYLMEFAGAYIVSNPDWCGIGGAGNAGGCLDSQGGPATSSHLDGFFWAQSSGDEAILAGNDNGTWAANIGWIKQVSLPNGYNYPSFISVDDAATNGYYGYPGPPMNWASTVEIDGCVDLVTPTIPRDECTCLLLTDEWDGQGYFAVFSELPDASGNYTFNDVTGFSYTMAPIPRPEITLSARDTVDRSLVTFNINVPTPTGGDFRSPSCDCNFGFRVYTAVVPEGSAAPTARRACTQRALVAAGGPNISYTDQNFAAACQAAGFVWVPASNVGGGTQPVVPFAGGRATAGVTVDCGDPTMAYQVFLATAIGAVEGPAGVQVGSVGENSFDVNCGNYTFAEPNRPERPSLPGRSGDAPRRGNRER